MVDYANLIAVAQRLITENGREVTLLQFDSTPDDVDKPWKGNSDPRSTPDDTLTLDAVFVEPSSAVKLGLSTEVSDLVKRSDQILIASPGASEDVRRFNELVDDGENWKIEGIETLKPGPSLVLVFIGVRR